MRWVFWFKHQSKLTEQGRMPGSGITKPGLNVWHLRSPYLKYGTQVFPWWYTNNNKIKSFYYGEYLPNFPWRRWNIGCRSSFSNLGSNSIIHCMSRVDICVGDYFDCVMPIHWLSYIKLLSHHIHSYISSGTESHHSPGYCNNRPLFPISHGKDT